MRFKALKIVVAALLLQALLSVPALAQDFNSLMSSAASTNQTWVDQINRALAAQDQSTFRSEASAAVATGQQLESILNQALALAPDDASRSRAQGLLNHVTAAVQSGQAALQTTDFGQARSQVNAMLGEAQEALTEVAPFETVTPPSVPSVLPSAGEYTAAPQAAGLATGLLAFGVLAILFGLGLRRRFA